MSLFARQALFARFMDDPELERSLRADPNAAAAKAGVDSDYALWLAQLEPRRVRAFRRSRVVKLERRNGPR